MPMMPYQQPYPMVQQPYQPRPQPYQRPAAPQPRERVVVREARQEERLTAAPMVNPVAIPTPEEVGVGTPGAVDWSGTRQQLSQLKASGFGLVPKPNGVQFYIELPGGRRAVGEGRTEAEAVSAALSQAHGVGLAPQ